MPFDDTKRNNKFLIIWLNRLDQNFKLLLFKRPLKTWKDKPQTGRKYLQNIYRIKNLYPEYIKNIYLIKIIGKMGKDQSLEKKKLKPQWDTITQWLK